MRIAGRRALFHRHRFCVIGKIISAFDVITEKLTPPFPFLFLFPLPSLSLQAYQRCLGTVELYGPTNFGPVIKLIAQFSKEKQEAKDYFVLLIISDNCATDLIRTKQVRYMHEG